MSKQIENNVVQMTFDNKDFEKNISTSSKSIEKLNEQLKFKDASEGFKDLEKYANNVNFDGLNKAISNINSVFTVTGKLAKNIVDDIAGYLENKIASAVNTVSRSINYVFDPSFGMQKYEQYTNALLSMTSNLSDYDKLHFKDNFGSELEFVEHYIETLALYADETSFSMTDMVDTMAKFAANNVDIAQSTSAMMGLGNMAAVAGQNAKTATASMYQLAQAFGTGYVRYQDWAQAFTLKNIATKESKEIFLKAAMEMHTINQEDIAKAKDELGDKNWMNWFFTSDKLNQGWLKTDTVLVKGLQEYSKASDLILASLENIGDVSVSEILTWTDQMKESGKSATEFIKDISGASKAKIDDVNLLTEVLDKLGTKEYELSLRAFKAAQNATNFHEALEATRDAVGTKMMYALKYFIGDLDQARKLWTKFANSLWNVFAAPLDNALAGLKIWNKGVQEFEEGILKSWDFVDDYDKFWSSLGRIFTNIGLIFDGLIDQFRILAGCFEVTEDGIVGTSIIAEYTLDFMQHITHAVGDLADATEKFLDSDLYQNIKDIFMYIIKGTRNTKRIVGSLFNATIGTMLENIGGPLMAISDILLEISKRFEWYTDRILKSENFNNFISTLTKLTAKIMELGAYLISDFGGVLLRILDTIFAISVSILNFLTPAIEAVLDFIEESVIPFIDTIIDGEYGLGKAIDWVSDKIDIAIPKVKEFTKEVFNMDFSDIKENFKKFTDGFVVDVERIGTEGFDKLKGFFKGSFDKDTKGSWAALIEAVSEADSVTEGVQNVAKWSGDAIMRPIQLVLDLASIITGTNLTEMGAAISKFIHSITDGMADITPNLFNFVEKVGTLLLGILKFVAGLIIDIIKYTAGMSDSTGFGLLDDFIYSIKTIFISLIEAFVYVLKQIAGIAPLITPAIKKSLDYVGDLMMAIAGLFKRTFIQIVNIKTPEEFLGYVKQLAKIVIALIVFIKLFMLLDDIIFVTRRFKMGFKTVKANIFTVTDAIAGVLDTIGGYGLPGMIRMFAILLASIGYSLAQVAKVGQMLSDKNTRKGIILAFTGVIITLVLFKVLVNSLMKNQNNLMKDMIKLKTKMGWGKFGNPDDSELKRTLEGIGRMLVGMGIAMIGISAAIGILAKVSNTTSKTDLFNAVASMAFLLLALGLFLKLAAVNQRASRSLTDGGYNSQREGKFYKGVAASLIGFAVAMLLITPAIALLSHTVKSAGVENFRTAVRAILNVLGIIGIMLAMIALATQQGGFLSSAGIVWVLKAMSKMLITIAVTVTGMALALIYLFDKQDREDVFRLLKGFTIIIGVLSALIAIMSFADKSLTWKQQLVGLGVKIAKMIFVSTILTGLAMVLAAISGSIYLLVRLFNKYSLNGKKVPTVVFKAILVIVAVLGILLLMVKVLMKSLQFEDGNWKAIIARVGGLFLILLAMSNMLVIISGVASIMSLILSYKRIGDNIWKAVGVMGAILGGLTVFMFLMTAIGKFAQGNSLTNKGDAARELVKIAAAITVVGTAIGILAAVFIAMAKATRQLDSRDMSTAAKVMIQLMVAIAAFSLALGVINIYFGGVITVLAGMFKALAYVILGVVAAILLFGKYGDSIVEWLNNARPKIEAGFRALGAAMISVVEGFNESLPLILEALSKTMLIILSWIAYNIDEWTFYIILILSKALSGIAEALLDESSELGTALSNIMLALEGVVLTFLENVLGVEISDWLGGLMGNLAEVVSRGIVYSIPGIGALVSKAEQKQAEERIERETEAQKALYNIRKQGAEYYLNMLQGLEAAENQMVIASTYTDEVAKSQAMARASANESYWSSKIAAIKDADKVFDQYGIDIKKSYEENFKNNEWWMSAMDADGIAMDEGQYHRALQEILGSDWNIGEAVMGHLGHWGGHFGGGKSKLTSNGGTGESKKDSENVLDLIMNKIQDSSSKFSNLFPNSGSDEKSTGAKMVEGFVGAIKGKAGDIKKWLSENLGDMGLTSILGGSTTDLTSNLANYDFGGAIQTNLDASSMQIPDIDTMYTNMDYSNIDMGGAYDETSYSAEQLNGIAATSASGVGSSDDIVNAINDEKTAIVDAATVFTQAILDKEYTLKLNNDVVAGELAPSLNKALGRMADFATKRGI